MWTNVAQFGVPTIQILVGNLARGIEDLFSQMHYRLEGRQWNHLP